MIKSVARVYRWTPEVIGNLYLDDADFFGLWYWYEDAKQMDNDLTNG